MDAKENNSGDEQQPKGFEVIVKGLSFDATEQDITEFFKNLCVISSLNLVQNKKDQTKNNKGYCFLKFEDEAEFKKALAQDGAEFMGRNLKIEEGKKKDEDSLAVFVGNLSWNVDSGMLKKEFEDCGDIENARVITEQGSLKSKGFGIVDFKNKESVEKALNKNGNELDGREMRIKISSNAPRNNRGRGGRGFNNGRGGGFRGDRGGYRGDRGGYRGDRGGFRGDRGDFRGGPYRGGPSDRGDGGGYRGDGGGYRGERGGYRGDRGGFRGGDRGGFRGDRGDRGGRGPRRGGRRGGYGDGDSDRD